MTIILICYVLHFLINRQGSVYATVLISLIVLPSLNDTELAKDIYATIQSSLARNNFLSIDGNSLQINGRLLLLCKTQFQRLVNIIIPMRIAFFFEINVARSMVTVSTTSRVKVF